MELFGNLERLAAGLYPYRWLVSALIVLVLSAAAYFVCRRSWHRILQRRPMATAIVAVPLLAIALPVGYYLISPLWTRTHLEEASPLMVAAAQTTEQRAVASSTRTTEPPVVSTTTPAPEVVATPAPAEVIPMTPTPELRLGPTPTAEPVIMSDPEPTPTSEPAPEPTAEIAQAPNPEPTPEPVIEPEPEPTVAPQPEPATEPEPIVEPEPEPVEFVPAVVRSGAFYGADDFHFGSGSALIIETEPGVYVLRFENFSVQNGPDLIAYLSTSPDGYGDGSYSLGQLKATDGSFNYDIPPGVDPWAYASVIIWCEPFAVLFATAPLV